MWGASRGLGIMRSPVIAAVVMSRRGVTTTEVMVGIGLLAIVATILTPWILSSRESARRNTCATHMAALTQAMLAYHDQHGSLPPAAIWSTRELQTLALQQSKRWDLFIQQNWTLLLLPHLGLQDLHGRYDTGLPISAPQNIAVRTAVVGALNCPSDDFNRTDNPFRYAPTDQVTVEFARGNYAINGGTNSFHTTEGSTSTPTGDHAHLIMDDERREFRYWGNGIAGFNQSFRLDDFQNGRSTLVAFNEIRAGIHSVDPRGAWALGHIASSVTWGHGVNGDASGPNNPWVRSDDIQGCGQLHDVFGPEELVRLGMPCVSYLDDNQNATSRSRHAGGVNAAFLDGAVRFVSNGIDPSLWHVMHARETPSDVLSDNFPVRLQWIGSTQEAKAPEQNAMTTQASSVTNSLGMEFVLIPAGEFTMGVPDLGNDHDTPPETPAHRVKITSPYFLAKTEVTQEQYHQILGENPSWHQPPQMADGWTPQLPVENVTWHQATAFCKRLSKLPEEKMAGRSYRLPTEAEWEYACRAGSSEPYRIRQSPNGENHSGEAAGQISRPLVEVGKYPANPMGLHDMRGNVWEWCSDWFDRDYYQRSPIKNPAGPAEGYIKLIRGGDWIYVGEGCYINYPPLAPWKSSKVVGFRVVCVKSPSTE